MKLYDKNGASNQLNSFEKDLEEIFFLDPPLQEDQGESKLEHNIIRFLSFSTKAATEFHKYTRQLCIELSLTPKVFL